MEILHGSLYLAASVAYKLCGLIVMMYIYNKDD
jgi:hypothetical protein